jgi:hypothetical protein
MAQIFHGCSEGLDGPETSTWGSLCESSRPALLHLACPLALKAKSAEQPLLLRCPYTRLQRVGG